MSTFTADLIGASFERQARAVKSAPVKSAPARSATREEATPLPIGWVGPMLVVAWLGYMVTTYLPM